MINIVVVGLTQTKLANLANTKVKREVLVAFINFFPLPVVRACITIVHIRNFFRRHHNIVDSDCFLE